MPSWPGVFLFETFLRVVLRESRCISAFCACSSPSESFFRVADSFGFSVVFSSFPYFAQKLFCFLVISLLVCLRAFPPPASWKNFFRCFRMSCFLCIVLSCFDIFLVSFLSPVTSGLSFFTL